MHGRRSPILVIHPVFSYRVGWSLRVDFRFGLLLLTRAKYRDIRSSGMFARGSHVRSYGTALDGGSGPSKSIAIDSSGLVAGNSFIGFDFLSSRIQFFAQSVQLRTVIIISLAIDGQ